MDEGRVVIHPSGTAEQPGLMRAGPPTLPESEVHVWCLPLDRPQEDRARFLSLLSPDERARAERFHFEKDRDRYTAARGLLRTLLGGYLGEDPSRICFTYGPQGKPALAAAGPGKLLEFNVSHSGDMAAYAFGWGRRLGIDLERVRPVTDQDRLAGRFFSPAESAFVRSLSGEKKLAAFFTIWTCKEAVLKAAGDGLTKPMNQTEVSLPDGRPASLVSVDGDEGREAAWRLESFSPFPGYQAALAVEGRAWEFVVRTQGEFDETH